MLTIKNLSVTVQDKHVLKDISMQFSLGKNYCILGQNGSGKSSLAMTLMGNSKYQIVNGKLEIEKGKLKTDISKLSPDQRAKKGIFLAFQHIPEIKGVKVFEFLRSMYDAKNETTTSFLKFKEIIQPILQELSIDKEFLRRDVNVGFSGGERRMLEILQVKLLDPAYIFLDEIDSGLDIDAVQTMAKILTDINTSQNCLIIITHVFKIIEHLDIDRVYVLEKGYLKTQGNTSLIEKIKKEGFTGS